MNMQKLDDIKPYSDNDNIRTFRYDVDDAELIWHRDKNTRTVEVLSGVDWKFQRDNELPFVMKVGDTINIEKMTYHRIHKGQDKLVIEIQEHED